MAMVKGSPAASPEAYVRALRGWQRAPRDTQGTGHCLTGMR